MIVVIVLSHLITKNGLLKIESKARAEKAFNVATDKKAKYLITCGWDYREDSKISLADAFHSYLEKKKIKDCSIISQKFSRDTVGDAIFSKIIFECLKLDLDKTKIIVISSDYHIKRVKNIFSRVFDLKIEYMKTNIGEVIDLDYQKILRKEEKSLKKFKSDFKYAENGNSKSFYETLRQNHSFYNGDIYPRICNYKKIKSSLIKQIAI